jgi:CRISPR-associated helicase Cas3/CRISPR-associated endonuclease Cas3-HD
MADSAGIAQRLWDEWLPRSVTSHVEEAAGGDEAGRTLVTWMAGIHDLGKATPAFACQVPDLADAMHAAGLRMPSPRYQSADAPHARCSQILLERWLTEEHSWDRDTARTYAVIPGGHHGVPPTSYQIGETRDRRPELLGTDEVWRAAQFELARFAMRLSGAESLLPTWRKRPLPQRAQTLVTAVVIVADWIASSDLFDREPRIGALTTRVDGAWHRLQLPGPWQAVEPQGTASTLLAARFALPKDAHAHPVQERALDLVRRHDSGLLVVEAPMGEGKTELSLLCAEAMAARTGAGGVFYALPTMATSDAMFSRVHQWLEQVPDARGSHYESGYLAHGKARFNEEFRGLVRLKDDLVDWDDVTDGPEEAGDVMVAHTWLSGRKRGPLSSFVVGTIDQALFLALKSRHVVLRHLALAGKVVVIDEVHASDDYMKVYLKRLLRWLGEYRVPTILMSATLAPADREEYAREYAQQAAAPVVRPGSARRRRDGADGAAPAVATPAHPDSPFVALRRERAYPLLTSVSPDGTVELERPSVSARNTIVEIERQEDTADELVTMLRLALDQGGSAAVIRNTVVRAQQTYSQLRDAFPDATVCLVHARMLARDRRAREQDLRAALGPIAGLDEMVRFGERKLIAVGTQVLEQSLDVDFDIMVSDLAPVDLLLQRMGRLHRHPRQNRSPLLQRPRFIVTGSDWSEDPPRPIKGSSYIYGERDLFAAIGVLDGRSEQRVHLPDDISRLVADASEGTFTRPETWTDPWREAQSEADRAAAEKRTRAKDFLLDEPKNHDLVGWLNANAGEADDSAQGQQQVRDTDASLEVPVVQRIDGIVHTMPPSNGDPGKEVQTDFPPDVRTAYDIAECSLRLPATLTASWRFDQIISQLERDGFAGWQRSPLLKGELVLVLDEEFRAELAGVPVRYDNELGLLIGDAAA